MHAQGALAGVFKGFFARARKHVAAEVAKAYAAIHKDEREQDAEQILDAVDIDWASLIDEARPYLAEGAADGAMTGLVRVGITDAGIVNQANENANAWAAKRAAELVGMRNVDGEWVENPNARWRIDEPTRDGLQSMVTRAMEENWTVDELHDAIVEAYDFSDERAEVIARTELAIADTQGTLIGYRESGVVEKKRWIVTDDDKLSEDCEANGAAGAIDLDDDFPSGDSAPPAHPNCRCAIAPVINRDEE